MSSKNERHVICVLNSQGAYDQSFLSILSQTLINLDYQGIGENLLDNADVC